MPAMQSNITMKYTGPKLDADRFSAYSKFTKKDLAMSAIATRDIEPGEEITVSCTGSYIPRHPFLPVESLTKQQTFP